MADPENADAIAFLVVTIPDPKPKSVRVNITVPENTLRQIDAMAKKRCVFYRELLPAWQSC